MNIISFQEHSLHSPEQAINRPYNAPKRGNTKNVRKRNGSQKKSENNKISTCCHQKSIKKAIFT